MARAALVLGLSLVGIASASAQSFTPQQRQEIVAIVRDALKSDPSILRDAVDALQADDGKQRENASRAAIAEHKGALVDAKDPTAGNPAGDVTVVEFFDVRCPYCHRLEPVMADLLRKDRGVRLVYKDLPILGPASLLGSKALLAAQKQGGYEKLREAIMSRPDVTKDSVRAAAERVGLNWSKLEADMENPEIKQRLDANIVLARKLGIQGTPALVIGQDLIPGAVELPDLQRAISDARVGRG